MIKKNIVLIVGLMLIATQSCLADDAKNITKGELNQEQGVAPSIGNDTIQVKTAEGVPTSIAEANLGLKQGATLGVRSDAIETKSELSVARIAQSKLESNQETNTNVRNGSIAKPIGQVTQSSKTIATVPNSFGRAVALPQNSIKSEAIKSSSGKN